MADVFVRHFGDRNADGEYEISPSSLAVMTSMINVGELVGSLSAAPLNDYFGRKGVFFIGTITIIVGVVLQLVTSSSTALITAGRAVLGFGVGNFSATSPLYMGVSSPEAMNEVVWKRCLSP
jgi:MFS family permease